MTSTTLSPDVVLELMAYADGELDGDEARARVEALLVENEEARRFVASMESPAIGQWLAASSDERAIKAGADAIADQVMLRVAAAPVSKVVPMRRRGAAITAVAVGVLALAAAGVLWVRSTGGSSTTMVARLSAPSANVVQTVEDNGGIEVDEVEAPSRDVSVYYLDQAPATAENTPSSNSVVIWIGAEKMKPGAP